MLNARQSFNLACCLQRDRIAAFLRPQSILNTLVAPPTTQAALSRRSDEEGEIGATNLTGKSRLKRAARMQLHRTNRNLPSTPSLFERYQES